MVYRLKVVRYQGTERRILLQNENGPCPLLAAANILLLKGVCSLPPSSIRNDVATLEDVTNMLAEHAMKDTDILLGSNHQHDDDDDDSNHNHAQQQHAVYVDELVQWIPKFQYGMDVNPTFNSITGYEYTAQLTAFDMLQCKLVHGWLVDMVEDKETFKVIGNKTYNELIERVIHVKEVQEEMHQLQTKVDEMKQQQQQQQQAAAVAAAAAPVVDLLDDTPAVAVVPQQQQQQQAPLPQEDATSSLSETVAQMEMKLAELQTRAHEGLLIQHFLESTGHQLTHYGLLQLHEHMQQDELTVFFRNNHFGTLTKHEGLLYLLVTDLGYANSPAIVWERLDVIDGNTEYVNSEFKSVEPQEGLLAVGPTLTPEQMMAASSQTDADYHLALHLSMQQQQSSPSSGNSNHGGVASESAASASATGGVGTLEEQEGQIMAAATEASLREYHGLSGSSSSPTVTNTTTSKGVKPGDKVEVGVPVKFTATGEVVQVPLWSQGKIPTQEDADQLLAMQLQGDHDAATFSHEQASLQLARQLQAEENQRARAAAAAAASTNRQGVHAQRQNNVQQQQRPVASSSRSQSSCVIS